MVALCTFEALYTPHALRASVSVLPGLIFSFYGHLDFKKDWFSIFGHFLLEKWRLRQWYLLQMGFICTFEWFHTPQALRGSVSVLSGLIFSFYGHLDLKIDRFFDIWALFTEKWSLRQWYLRQVGFICTSEVSHPTGTSGKCFRASWPHFELLTHLDLKIDQFFDIWALFECQNTDS